MKGVSVIICCYNSAARIVPTLKHLGQQNTNGTTPWEIVLVNNASSDNTVEIARETWKSLGEPVQLNIMEEDRPGLIYARETGIEAANYEFVIYCDDDNWLHKNYIQSCYTLMSENPEIEALRGIGTAVCTTAELPSWFQEFEKSYATGSLGEARMEIQPEFSFGAGCCLRLNSIRELFQNGFIPQLIGRKGSNLTSGEDIELFFVLNQKGKIVYTPELQFYHEIPENRLNWQYLVKVSQGKGKARPFLALYRSFTKSGASGKLSFLYRFRLSHLAVNLGMFILIPFEQNKMKRRLKWTKEIASLAQMFSMMFSFGKARKQIKTNLKIGSLLGQLE